MRSRVEDLASTQVLLIPVDRLPESWGAIATHFLVGTRHMPGGMQETVQRVMRGDLAVWAVFQTGDCPQVLATFLTGIIYEPDGRKVVGVTGLGGKKLPAYVRTIDETMREHARRMGCSAVRFIGGPAYRRMLPEYRPAGALGADTVYERAVP